MYMLNCTLEVQSFACMRLLLGAKSMPSGCMSMARLGAKYAVVGFKSMDTFGCMSMPFGCMSMYNKNNYINNLITVMVLKRIILASLSLSWYLSVLY